MYTATETNNHTVYFFTFLQKPGWWLHYKKSWPILVTAGQDWEIVG